MSRSNTLAAAALAAQENWRPGWVGTVQPHGMLLVLREPQLRIVQASTSAAVLLQRPLDTLLLATLHELGGDLETSLRALLVAGPLHEPQALRCRVGHGDDAPLFEGSAHRTTDGVVVLELEPATRATQAEGRADPELPQTELLRQLSQAVQCFSTAATAPTLAAEAAQRLRVLTGYDRVLVTELDDDGGWVLHEAADQATRPAAQPGEPWVRPSARARRAYLAQRVRVVVDAQATPSELLPQLPPGSGGEVDLARSELRSTSGEHARRLRELGLAASMVVALVREGRLWGLFVCHHATPRRPSPTLRAAAELLAEAFVTRVGAIENRDRSQLGQQMRLLEQRLLEAVSRHGDWHAALLQQQAALLDPLRACGALLWSEGTLLSCGRAPQGQALQEMLRWLETRPAKLGECACGPADSAVSAVSALKDSKDIGTVSAGPGFDALAVSLSAARGDCLVWLRESRATAEGAATRAWSRHDLSLAAAFGGALLDMDLRVNAVRLLIAEYQLTRVRAAIADAREAVLLLDARHRVLHANAAFQALTGRQAADLPGADALAALFSDPDRVRHVIGQVRAEQRPWHGDMVLRHPDGLMVPVAIRAEPVLAADHMLLGSVFVVQDQRKARHADTVRQRLETMLTRTGRDMQLNDDHALIGAIIANAGLAAMDIAEGGGSISAQLEDVEASTGRATALLQRIHAMGETPAS